MAEIAKVIVLSLTSIVVLFILTKLMGYRQMSQLSMFDYINGITIGSIAAELSTSLEDNFMAPLVSMVIYGCAAILLSEISIRSIKLRRIINGRSILLYRDGLLYFQNLKKAKIDLQEFLLQCRVSGYFDLSELKLAVLEPNGKISFLPTAATRPLSPADMNLTPPEESYAATIIVDGRVLKDNLKRTGNSREWLDKQLKANKLKDIKQVKLATCSMDNQFAYYLSSNGKGQDIFN